MRLVFYAMDERDVAGAGGKSPVISGTGRCDCGRLIERGVTHGRVGRSSALGNGFGTSSVRFDIPSRNGERSCRISGIIVYEVADSRGILLTERRAGRVDAFSMVPASDEFTTEV